MVYKAAMDLPLIPGRSCDACVECCRFIPLDLPELSKPTGSLCAYCVDARGCTVHEVRPQTCRTWFCVWRIVELSEDWRPDRSGVIVRPDGLEREPGNETNVKKAKGADNHGGGITDKPEIVALSQIDLLDEDELKKKTKALQKACGQPVLQLSAVANVGMVGALRAVRDVIVQSKNAGSDD